MGRTGARLEVVAPGDELTGDGDALDLVRALADAQERRVAVVALDVILGGVAVRAVDAHRLGGVLERGLRRHQLGHARLHVAALTSVERTRGAAGEQTRR